MVAGRGGGGGGGVVEGGAHLCVVEDAAAVVRPDDCVLPVLAEVGSGDEARLAVHLVPQRHLLVRNVPETQLPVQRAAQEVPVVLRRATH